jgi:hypothetical protein
LYCNRIVEHIFAVISHAWQHRKRPARVRTVPHQAHAQGTNRPETCAKVDALLSDVCAGVHLPQGQKFKLGGSG